MHLYRSLPVPNRPVFIDQNSTFSNSHHNTFIRIESVLDMILPDNLRNDFICTLRISIGCSLNIIPETTENVVANEGLFLEGGENCQIISDGVGGFEVVRNRPVQSRGWNLLSIYNEVGNQTEQQEIHLENALYRVMRNGEILFQTTETTSIRWAYFFPDNPNFEDIEIWTTGTRIMDGTMFNWVGHRYTDLSFLDFSLVSGVEWEFYATSQTVVKGLEAAFNFPGFKIVLNATLGNNYVEGVINEFNGRMLLLGQGAFFADKLMDISNRSNLQYLDMMRSIGSNVDIVIKDNPLLSSIKYWTQGPVTNSLDISGCPSLDYVYLRNSTTVLAINIDSLFQELDANGVVNGTSWTSENYTTTAASDASRASLVAKGWTLKRNYLGTLIE